MSLKLQSVPKRSVLLRFLRVAVEATVRLKPHWGPEEEKRVPNSLKQRWEPVLQTLDGSAWVPASSLLFYALGRCWLLAAVGSHATLCALLTRAQTRPRRRPGASPRWAEGLPAWAGAARGWALPAARHLPALGHCAPKHAMSAAWNRSSVKR